MFVDGTIVDEGASCSGLVAALDATHEAVSRAQRDLLSLISEFDRSEEWRGSGARDTAHWLVMR